MGYIENVFGCLNPGFIAIAKNLYEFIHIWYKQTVITAASEVDMTGSVHDCKNRYNSGWEVAVDLGKKM